MAGRQALKSLPKEIVRVDSVDDNLLCGETAAHETGVCGVDTDGAKCIRSIAGSKLRELLALSKPELVSQSSQMTCGVLKSGGALYCLTPAWETLPRRYFKILPESPITAVRATNYSACWGTATKIECFDGADRDKFDFAGAFEIASGLACWGDLSTHKLEIPSGLSQPGAVIDFALGENRTCVVRADQTLQCWGDLAYADEEPPALTGVTAISGSRQHSFCAKNASGLHCWGGENAFPR